MTKLLIAAAFTTTLAAGAQPAFAQKGHAATPPGTPHNVVKPAPPPHTATQTHGAGATQSHAAASTHAAHGSASHATPAGPSSAHAPKQTTAHAAKPTTSSHASKQTTATHTHGSSSKTATQTGTGPKATATTTASTGSSSSGTPLTPVQQKLQKNTNLAGKLQSRLPAGTDLNAAAAGFKNLGQFVAAVNVSHNLGIPFDRLKTSMVTDGRSLGQSIQTLKQSANAEVEAPRAEREATVLIAETETAPPARPAKTTKTRPRTTNGSLQ